MFNALFASISLVALISGANAFAAKYSCAVHYGDEALASGVIDSKDASSQVMFEQDAKLRGACAPLTDMDGNPVGAIGCMIEGTHPGQKSLLSQKLRLNDFENEKRRAELGWASLSYTTDEARTLGLIFAAPGSSNDPIYVFYCKR